jgi:hypothetical protein
MAAISFGRLRILRADIHRPSIARLNEFRTTIDRKEIAGYDAWSKRPAEPIGGRRSPAQTLGDFERNFQACSGGAISRRRRRTPREN